MCGRYILNDDDEQLFAIMARLQREKKSFKRGEVFPGDDAAVILQGGEPEVCRWGYPGIGGGKTIINARRETAAEKPMFRESVAAGRCVVPASGFYEWMHGEDEKIKYLFDTGERRPVFMAALCAYFDNVLRFVILTGKANASMEDVHSRMPLVLDGDSMKKWLDDTSYAKLMLTANLPMLRRREA